VSDARRRLRIEMVLPDLVGGGMEVMVANLTRSLAEHGHEVGLTCLFGRGDLAEELAARGHRVSVVGAPGLRTNWHAPALVAHLASVRPDVAHVHSGVWPKGARAARQAGVPRVGHTAHGLLDRESWIESTLQWWAGRHTDWVAAVSAPLVDHLVRRLGVSAEKVRVLLNGIDTARFAPGPRSGILRERLGVGERPLVGIVARLAVVKNHALLLRAFARLRADMPDAALVLVGEGPMRAEITQRVAELGLTEHVFLTGAIGDVAAVYRDLDLFVLSSTSEGTSMSILEAMASGVPVVATDVGGNGELLDGGRCGRLVPSGDEAAMSAAMARALAGGAETRALTAAARERAVTSFSHETMVDGYEVLYGARRGDATIAAAMTAPALARREEVRACAE
jgi:glycosyltransferase involved in cell wall biosynthesis